jgi:hypothetical protein
MATFAGHHRGDVWWLPTRRCLELMAVTAGFLGIDWKGQFLLKPTDGSAGSLHGVLHAYKTAEGWTPTTRHRDEVLRGPAAGPATDSAPAAPLRRPLARAARWLSRRLRVG